MKLNYRIDILAVLILVFALVFGGCAALEEAAQLTEYDFSTDKIVTVNAVNGSELTVTNVATGTSNGMQYKEYTYESTTKTDDLIAYTTALRDNGWLVLEDYDLTLDEGKARLATQSADEGKIIIMTISFKSDGYIVRMEKVEGSLTSN